MHLAPGMQAPHIFGQDLKNSEVLLLWYLHIWAKEQNESGLLPIVIQP
jgi:hypothetical protein